VPEGELIYSSSVRAAAAWLIWPLLIAGAVAAISAALARGVPAPLALSALQVLVAIVVVALERWSPEYPSWNQPRHDLLTDALHFVVSGMLIATGLRALIFYAVPSFGLWPAGWPVVAQVVLALALVDLGSYLTHVATHKTSWLWPIHAPHHSAQRLYWLNSARMHVLDAATTVLAGLLPLALLGVPRPVLALFDAIAITHLMVQHSNVRLRHGLLSQIFATAEFHRWHHSAVRGEGERNYASFFALLDHAGRTFRLPAGQRPPEAIGLYDGATLPDSWLGQLRSPFVAWARR
jgi:sterol desaturase/sphingolipid hydroxylase (fatty acid hydroxylase superfamily)